MWLKRCFPYQIKEDFLPDEPTLAGLLERMRSRELPSLEKLGLWLGLVQQVTMVLYTFN